MNKLYLLSQKPDLPPERNPWLRPYDVNNEFLIAAPDEAKARELAQRDQDMYGGTEGRSLPMSGSFPEMRTPWLSEEYTVCQEVQLDGPPKVVMVNYTDE